MKNRQIQEERIKTYFLDSAKSLLRAEGLKSVSVRNIADHAGYSYATLYNYFKDINDLLFRCVVDFCAEAESFVDGKIVGMQDGREKLRATARAYAEYFTEYPGVFELLFLERMGDFGNRKETALLITGLIDRLCAGQLEKCVAGGIYSRERADSVMARLHYLLPGMLLMYENRLEPDDYKEFMKSLDLQLRLVLD